MDFDDDDDQEEELEDEEDEEMGMPTPVSRPKVVNNNLGSVVGVALGGETTVSGGGSVRKPSGGLVGGNNGGASGSSILMTCSNVRYRECLKNHAIGVGGHAVDGCGEFMPAGDDGTLDALKCAACNCHRNFHRKEITEGGGAEAASSSLHHHHQHPHHHVPHHHHHQQHPFTPQYYRPPGNYIPMVTPHSRPLALPSISGGGHSRDMDMQDDDVSNPSGGGGMGGGSSSSKKRFRTKFTQEQKDKMLAFAERLGWRIQKHDEVAVQQFCNELCIKRQVLKVWMHNNKHTLGKKP